MTKKRVRPDADAERRVRCLREIRALWHDATPQKPFRFTEPLRGWHGKRVHEFAMDSLCTADAHQTRL